jgi:toxin ParE1/3/4
VIAIRWTETAASDLRNIHDYIAHDSLTVARAVCAQRYDAVSQLGDFPDLGRSVPERPEPALRELVRPPYRIVYERRADTVFVLTVFHAARMFPHEIRQPAR